MPKPLQTASGDLLADRRADYAEMLFAAGDHAAAAELMLDALELAPDWSFGWFRLGEFHEAAGVLPAAVEAWRTALKLDASDRVGAALKLRLAGVTVAGDVAPGAFVETLFDQYAGSFDVSLVGKLGYRVPELLDAVIAAQCPEHIGFAIDLGCGTGLMGERLRPRVDRLEGYDISAEMLRKAEAKRLYDRLVKADLETLRYDGAPADLVTAADVFMYVGALDRVVALARSMLRAGGTFAFSVEKNDGPRDVVLKPSRRHAHAPAYVERVLRASGLDLLAAETETIRQDRGEPVTGLICIAIARI